jgi:hypothetical protein
VCDIECSRTRCLPTSPSTLKNRDKINTGQVQQENEAEIAAEMKRASRAAAAHAADGAGM